MKKKVLIVLAIVFSVILVFYAVELISTNSLMNYVKDLADGKIPASETEGEYWDEFNVNSVINGDHAKFKITRVFVIHNFSDGYMWLKWDFWVYDKDDNLIYGHSQGFPPGYAKWTIHKENGEWKVVDVWESP